MPFPVNRISLIILLGLAMGCNQRERLKVKAKMGNRRAMYEYGSYLWGNGAGPIEEEAIGWMTKAAEKGETEAMFKLGRIYKMGGGAKPEAVYWFRKGAEAGDRRCMIELGGAYRFGLMGLPVDEAQAKKWYAAAEQARSPEDRRMWPDPKPARPVK